MRRVGKMLIPSLSAVLMCTLIAFGLHNSGRSDKGMATAIAAAFWVASCKEKTLTPEELGRRSSGKHLLCQWEKRYAAECFVLKCFKMKQNGTEDLHSTGNGVTEKDRRV
jgi:hypothetical protein